MQDIPRIVLSEIFEMIEGNIKIKMIKHLYQEESDPGSTFDEYIRQLLNDVFFTNELVDYLEVKNQHHRKKQMMKKSWYSSILKDAESGKSTPIHSEKEMMLKLLDKKQGLQSIREIFTTDNPDELLPIRLKEIEDWAKDPTTFISDYPYLESKKRYQLEKAFHLDIICLISDYLKGRPAKVVSERALKLIDVSSVFEVSQRTKTSKGNLIVNPDTKKTSLYDQYKLSNDLLIVSILQPDENDQIVLDKMVHLDEKDSQMIDMVLNNRGERFYKEKKVVVDLRELVREIYNSESSKAYNLVKERLKKIGQFSIEGRILNKNQESYREFLFNFFQFVDIKKETATGRIYAEITLSDALHEQYISNQTIQIYSHLIKKLENPVSRLLIYAFQKERIEAFSGNRPLKIFFEYNYFHDRIRLRSKRIDTNLKIIEESLKEFKELNILISHYERKGNGFNIHLYPITEDEQEDIFAMTNTYITEGS